MKRAIFIFLFVSVFSICGCGKKETPPHVVELYNTILAEANEDEIGVTLEELQKIRPNCEKYKIAEQIDAKITELMAEKDRIPEKLLELIKSGERKQFSKLYNHAGEYFQEIDLTYVKNEKRLYEVEFLLKRKRFAIAKGDLEYMDTSTFDEEQKSRYGKLLSKIPNDPKLTNPLSITAYQKQPSGKYKKIHGENSADPEKADTSYFK